jgi:hypothetical protein
MAIASAGTLVVPPGAYSGCSIALGVANSKEEARQRRRGLTDTVETTRAHNCQTVGLRKKMLNCLSPLGLSMEGKDIYILLAFALLCWRRPVSPHWRRPVASLAITLLALSMMAN